MNLSRIPGLHIPRLIYSPVWISNGHLLFNMSKNKLQSAPPQACPPVILSILFMATRALSLLWQIIMVPSLTPSFLIPHVQTAANPVSSAFKMYPNPTTPQHLHCCQPRLSHHHLWPELKQQRLNHPPSPLAGWSLQPLLAQQPEGSSKTLSLIMSPFCSKRKKSEGGLPWWSSGKESAFQCRGRGFNPWSGN